MLSRGRAREVLGVIRIVNGAAALLAPKRLLAMLRVDPEQNGAAVYAFRLFGIRTVLLGVQLFSAEGEALDRAVREAPLIHASDTASAAIAGLTGQLPRRAALTAMIISSLNTFLALRARRERLAGETASR